MESYFIHLTTILTHQRMLRPAVARSLRRKYQRDPVGAWESLDRILG